PGAEEGCALAEARRFHAAHPGEEWRLYHYSIDCQGSGRRTPVLRRAGAASHPRRSAHAQGTAAPFGVPGRGARRSARHQLSSAANSRVRRKTSALEVRPARNCGEPRLKTYRGWDDFERISPGLAGLASLRQAAIMTAPQPAEDCLRK